MNETKYPIYIISKGRWQTRQTSRTLEYLKIPYHIVIEPQEYSEYSKVIDKNKIFVLPFSNLNQGSIPARNWVWEHSISIGAKKHWIMDDNIWQFYYSFNNERVKAADHYGLLAIEDFSDRFINCGISGPNYKFFVPDMDKKTPITFNTRIYSCILIDNSIEFRWRGKYNEDTDLSLRYLKTGGCTALHNWFICGKTTTLTMKGGNTDILYKQDGREKMADSLVEQHPDVTKKIWHWGRWQHFVDYRKFFQNKLIYREGFNLENERKIIFTRKEISDKELDEYNKYLLLSDKKDNQEEKEDNENEIIAEELKEDKNYQNFLF